MRFYCVACHRQLLCNMPDTDIMSHVTDSYCVTCQRQLLCKMPETDIV